MTTSSSTTDVLVGFDEATCLCGGVYTVNFQRALVEAEIMQRKTGGVVDFFIIIHHQQQPRLRRRGLSGFLCRLIFSKKGQFVTVTAHYTIFTLRPTRS